MSKVVKEVVSDKFTGEVTVEYSDDSTNKFNIADTVVAVTNSGNTSVTKLQANNIDLAVFTPEEKSKVVMAETDPVTGGIEKIINVQSFSDAAVINEKALVFVAEDETNDGQMAVYFHNGQALNWLPSVEV